MLADDSPANDIEIARLGLFWDFFVVAVVRNARLVVPRGDIVVRAGVHKLFAGEKVRLAADGATGTQPEKISR